MKIFLWKISNLIQQQKKSQKLIFCIFSFSETIKTVVETRILSKTLVKFKGFFCTIFHDSGKAEYTKNEVFRFYYLLYED